jgi:hypothetical protein
MDNKLETIKAEELGLRLGFLPENVIPVILKDEIDKDFTVYLTTKEEIESNEDWKKIQLAFSSTKNNYITTTERNVLRTYEGLSEYAKNLIVVV